MLLYNASIQLDNFKRECKAFLLNDALSQFIFLTFQSYELQ